MKVLVTVASFYPLKDGVQNVTEYLCRGLIELGNTVTVVTSLHSNNVEKEVYKGIEIIRTDVHTRFGLYFGNRKKYRKLIINLSKDYDLLINVCTQNALTDLLYSVLDKIECKKLLHMHGMHDFKWHKCDFLSFPRFCYKLWRNIRWGFLYAFRNFKKYDAVIQLHEMDSANLFFRKKYKINSFILTNSCDSSFHSERSRTISGNYFICVSNYIERKNQEFILRAFYSAQNVSNYSLVFVGGSETKYLDSLKKIKETLDSRFGTRDVRFLVDISREEVASLVRGSFAYLMGSTWEAFSISIIESMASGVPYISTDVGITKYLPGGVVIKKQKEMSHWIDLFIEQNYVAELIGKAGLSFYENKLSLERTLERYKDIVYGIVEKRD